MKRIALLLAAAAGLGTGTGCTVSTASPCNTGTLTVDWSLVAANGATNVACNSSQITSPTGSPVAVADLDVYVDGVPYATYVSCNNYSASMGGVPSGTHQVTVLGFDLQNHVLVRDSYPVNVAACSETFFTATPGQATVEFLPSSCEPTTTYLDYELRDVTGTPPAYIFSSVYPADAKPFTCQSGTGVSLIVPWGDYSLTGMDETNAGGSLFYARNCTATTLSVWSAGVVHSANVNLTPSTIGCF
jgi:hypothetical protein